MTENTENSPVTATVETITRLPTAEEVEKVMLDRQVMSPEEVEKLALETHGDFAGDPMAQASTLYGLYAPKFMNGLYKLSSNQLRRLIRALIEAPFWTEIPKFRNKDEEEMFMVGDRLLQAKMVMVGVQFAEQEKATETQTTSSNAVNEGETNNG